jgi:hypothetical protein
MAGRFIISNYEREDGSIGPIRVQPETVTSWNPQATGSKTGSFVRARGSKRSYGTVARSVSLGRAVGDGTDYSSAVVSLRVPMFTKTSWEALAAGQVLSYAGKTDWVVQGTNSEESK